MRHPSPFFKPPVLGFTLLFIFALLFTGCPPPEQPPDDSAVTKELRQGTVESDTVRGAPFEPYRPPEGMVPNKDEPRIVPDAPGQDTIEPANKSTGLLEWKADEPAPPAGGGDPVVFPNYQPLGTGTASVSHNAADMSHAQAGDVILLSGNWYAALSTDGGANFTILDPTTIFPNTDASGSLIDGGFCCDQVIQYASSQELFIWLMQFCGDQTDCLGDENRIRIAVASPGEVEASAGTAWTYWDFTSSLLGQTRPFDYPDMSVGNNYLYWSADVYTVGLMVARVPLAELARRGTVNFQYIDPADAATAYGAHLSQTPQDEVHWLGHVDNAKVRVFSMKEGEGVYRWRDIGIYRWPNGTISSTSPDGTTNWLQFGFPGHAAIAAARTGGDVWFGWTAAAGGNFPHPHVQLIQIRLSDYSLTGQSQVWNENFAFAYPYFSSNQQGELGMSLAFGGGSTYYGTHGVGIWGDFVVWYPTLSSDANTRWGDYTTVRRANPWGQLWSASGYTVSNPGGTLQFNPHYILFGRESAVAASGL